MIKLGSAKIETLKLGDDIYQRHVDTNGIILWYQFVAFGLLAKVLNIDGRKTYDLEIAYEAMSVDEEEI